MGIRGFQASDLAAVMQIWLDTNLQAHEFIPREYWTGHYTEVEGLLPQAEVYLFQREDTGEIEGFVGLSGDYIAGIFVRAEAQSRGIGRQLLNYAKGIRPALSLRVYQKNARAVRFYQREGFEIQAREVDEAAGEEELVMVWSGPEASR